MLDAGREVGYWMQDAGPASAEREVGYWMLDAGCRMLVTASAEREAGC